MMYPSGKLNRRREKWLAGPWILEKFNEKLLPTQRKVEWRRFRDQFERICKCKIPVDPETKLTGMKIHSGQFLLNIIEMQEKKVVGAADIYTETIKLIDNYFDSTCSKTQERIKFRQMKQNGDENFADWVLRLESQSTFCDFEDEQRKEEFHQALISNSVPELAEKLFEASSLLNNDVTKMIQHGQHLDVLRMKKANEKLPDPVKIESMDDNSRPVMWIEGKNQKASYFKGRNENRQQPYQSYRDKREEFRPRNWIPRNKECDKCGRRHVPNKCPSFRSKCNKCGVVGHWAARCRSVSRLRKSNDNKEDMFQHVDMINKVESE